MTRQPNDHGATFVAGVIVAAIAIRFLIALWRPF